MPPARRTALTALWLGAAVWACATASSSGPTAAGANPTLTSLSPATGRTGTTVVVKGSNFSPSGNHVHFGIGYIANVPSSDGTTLRFVVPDILSPCQPDSRDPCATVLVKVTAGSYRVSVLSGGSTSNETSFTVTD